MFSLEDEFMKASDYITTNHKKVGQDVLLRMYGYYKQATVGNCNTLKPSFFDFGAREKWKSWNRLANMSKMDAMQFYVQTLDQAIDNWRSDFENVEENADGKWVAVSSMTKETELPDSAKNVFDWVKDGDLNKLKQCGKLSAELRDEEDLSLLHWAADRGHEDIVRYLVEDVKIDINCRDGENQTPLHYASACGHTNICSLLIQSGADTKAKDKEGRTAKDLAETPAIVRVFE